MQIPLNNGKIVDTERDLSAAERHILQKLFGWKSMVGSLTEFREKTEKALQDGWNNSGPVRKSSHLLAIIDTLETELMEKLRTTPQQQ